MNKYSTTLGSVAVVAVMVNTLVPLPVVHSLKILGPVTGLLFEKPKPAAADIVRVTGVLAFVESFSAKPVGSA